MSVVQLKPSNAPAKKTVSRNFRRKMQRQAFSAVAIGGVAIALTALSLSHLAHGITIVTASPTWEAWAMAAGIDLGFIAMELAQITASNEKVAKQISRFTKPAIAGTLIGSGAMNAFAFASAATGYMIFPAVAMGAVIPALIYSLTRIGAALYIDCNNKN